MVECDINTFTQGFTTMTNHAAYAGIISTPRRMFVRCGASAQVLRFPAPQPHPQGFELIADFGHPNGPGWQWVVALLILTQAALMFATNPPDMMRPLRVRPTASRTARTRKD